MSSTLPAKHSLQGQDRVLDTCQALNAKQYINAIGGIGLYEKEAFRQFGIDLYFIQSELLCYEQFGRNFVPFLSILDVLMFNSIERIQRYLKIEYKLI